MEFKPMDKQEIRSWYGREFTETFPPNEQKPLAFILELVDAGRYTLLGLYDGETLLGSIPAGKTVSGKGLCHRRGRESRPRRRCGGE